MGSRSVVEEIFEVPKPVICMVHLKALPGAPRYEGDLNEVYKSAVKDAKTAVEAGANGLLVENYNDKPYFTRVRDPVTVSVMSVVTKMIRDEVGVPLGVNVLRNSAVESLAIALAAGARFIRVNLGVGTSVSPEGLLEPVAAELMRYRRFIRADDIKVFMDVHVKHSRPLWERSIEESAMDAVDRGLADAIIVTGERTGVPPSPEAVARVKRVIGDTPVLVGSGVDPSNIGSLLKHADGVIIGTYIKVNGRVENPIDYNRVKLIVGIVERLRKE